MKRSFSLCLLFTFFYLQIAAQIPAGYYEAAHGKKGYALQKALFDIIKVHETLSYNSLWEHFKSTDKKANGKVWDIYSDIPGGKPPYEYTFGSDQCGDVNANEGHCYNREHSLPKSWFNDASPMNSDLFHLYPTDGQVNGRRSSYAYGEVSSASWTSKNGSKVGKNTYSGYSGTVFEPIDDFKGDLARTYFYMSTCYMNKNLGQGTNSMFTGSRLDRWALNMLLEWHLNDPVSQKEIDRNNEVYKVQQNRNPFIDYPELAGKIWTRDSLVAFNPAPTADPCIGCNLGISCLTIGNQIKITDQGEKYYEHPDRSWDVTATSVVGIDRIIYCLDGDTVSPYSNENSSLNGVRFPVGKTIVTWKAINLEGGSATCHFEVTVSEPDHVIFHEKKEFFSIYPNPAQNSFSISTLHFINHLSMLTIQGKEVKEWKNIKEGVSTLDISDIPSGFYLLQVSIGKRSVHTKIIIL